MSLLHEESMDGDVSVWFRHWLLELVQQQAVPQQDLPPQYLKPEVAGDLQNPLRALATSMILDLWPLHSTRTSHPRTQPQNLQEKEGIQVRGREHKSKATVERSNYIFISIEAFSIL
jgi:hypothetical protein